jgi:hypothetical protein
MKYKSLLRSQQPNNDPQYEKGESHPHPISWEKTKHFNFILPSMPRSSEQSLFVFPLLKPHSTKKFVMMFTTAQQWPPVLRKVSHNPTLFLGGGRTLNLSSHLCPGLQNSHFFVFPLLTPHSTKNDLKKVAFFKNLTQLTILVLSDTAFELQL